MRSIGPLHLLFVSSTIFLAYAHTDFKDAKFEGQLEDSVCGGSPLPPPPGICPTQPSPTPPTQPGQGVTTKPPTSTTPAQAQSSGTSTQRPTASTSPSTASQEPSQTTASTQSKSTISTRPTTTTTFPSPPTNSELDESNPEESQSSTPSSSVQNFDPFWSTPAAEQLTCHSTGTPCANCNYLDWLKLYNKTISSTPPFQTTGNSNEQDCFRRCNATTTSCIAYTFNVNGTCNLYSRINFENVQNATDSYLYFRISPRFLLLNEWIVSINTVPRDKPMTSRQVNNYKNCTIYCSLYENCIFAVFNKSDSTCSLYTKGAAQLLAFESNLVSIQHMSLGRTDNLWRFLYMGPVFQFKESPNASTASNSKGCKEACFAKEECQLVTASATNKTTVDCYLYDRFDNVWYEDDPPTTITYSYFKLVPRNNTRFRRLPSFIQIAEANPVETVTVANASECHIRARGLDQCYFYTFNSTISECNMYDSSVQMKTYKIFPDQTLTTYSKSIPTLYAPYYAYDNFWVFNVSAPGNSSNVTGELCLGSCLDLTECVAVAIQRPQGNCTFYGSMALENIRSDHRNQANTDGVTPVQVFVKQGDTRFTGDNSHYRCYQNRTITWDEINHKLKFDSLDNIREEIPEGNNSPLEPHGNGFEGQGNETAAPTFRNYRSRPIDEIELRWQRGNRIIRGILMTIGGIAGGVAGGGVGSAGGLVGAGAGAAAGTSAGAWVGDQFAKGIDTVICWFTTCEPPKEEKESCVVSCNSSAVRPIPWDPEEEELRRRRRRRKRQSSGTVDCQCWSQPRAVRRDQDDGSDQSNPDVQENCIGKFVGEQCNMCCPVGYEVERNPTCTCSDSTANYWDPNPAICRPERSCFLAYENYAGVRMPLVRVTDCLDRLYYGLVYNFPKKIPFYSFYHYSQIFRDSHNVAFRRPAFVGHPCTEDDFDEMQLTYGDYQAMNAIHRYPYFFLDVGHLAPNSDFKFGTDPVLSTFFYANGAPQDHNSNVKWAQIEGRLQLLFNQDLPGTSIMRQGYVMTGVCLDTDNEYPVPDCFWKLACTRDDTGRVTVAGFYHQNIISQTTNEKNERSREIYQIRDQRAMPNLGAFDLLSLWETVGNFYPGANVFGTGGDMYACQQADPINFPNFPLPSTPARSQPFAEGDEDYSLYNFWNENIFGEGFNGTVDEAPTDGEAGQSESGSAPSCGRKVVGYVTGWSDVKFTQSAASYLTHVIFAFVQMLSDGSLVVGSADPENSKDVSVDTKKSYLRLYEIKSAKEKSIRGLRTIFAVGGWANSQFYSNVADNPGLTQNFIRTALEIIDYFDMDGIDVDWEYPVTGGANEGVKQDRENYLVFLRAVREALNSHQASRGRSEPYTLTIAGAAGAWVLDDGFDLPAIADIVDWINVMTYDYYGAWDSKWGAYTGPHAPLYFGAPQGYSGKTNVDYTLKYYTCRVGDPSKLLMGLGFYGRFWNNSGSPVGDDPLWRKAINNGAGRFDGGFEPWRNIDRNYLPDGSYTLHFHEKTKTPYLENSNGFLMGYEDPQSIFEKVKYAAAKGFGGIMIWAIDLDDGRNSMLRTASSETLCSGATNVPSGYKCPPIQEQRWWTLLDDEQKAGMCGKAAPLYKGYYPVCDPEDPGYACCSSSGYCGSGETFCNCDGCVDYYENPEKILDEPIRPSGPVRWHTMDKFTPGPQCGYSGHLLENGEYAICNPDDNNGYCCSAAGYCGNTAEFCDCEGCVNFRNDPGFEYPEKTWIDSGPDAGKCGSNAEVNGRPATCNPMSSQYYCCSASGYCGSGEEYCDCDGCTNYKQ